MFDDAVTRLSLLFSRPIRMKSLIFAPVHLPVRSACLRATHRQAQTGGRFDNFPGSYHV